MARSNLRLYMICPREGSCFFDKVSEGAKKAEDELKQYGVKIEYLHTTHHNISRQAQLLTQAMESKPDGIALVPSSMTELNLLIDEAVDSGIPVLTFNNDAPYSKRFCYVGPDNYSSGRLCGELMGNFLSSRGNVLILSGNNEVYGLKQRLLGFRDKLKMSYPDIKVLDVVDYANDESICHSYTAKELSTHKDIGGIFATSATGSMAVGRVLKDFKLPSPPKVIGFDPNRTISQFMQEGLIHALIYQDPFTQGYLAIKVLFDYVSSGIVPENENLYTKIEIVLRENLENFIRDNL